MAHLFVAALLNPADPWFRRKPIIRLWEIREPCQICGTQNNWTQKIIFRDSSVQFLIPMPRPIVVFYAFKCESNGIQSKQIKGSPTKNFPEYKIKVGWIPQKFFGSPHISWVPGISTSPPSNIKIPDISKGPGREINVGFGWFFEFNFSETINKSQTRSTQNQTLLNDLERAYFWLSGFAAQIVITDHQKLHLVWGTMLCGRRNDPDVSQARRQKKWRLLALSAKL